MPTVGIRDPQLADPVAVAGTVEVDRRDPSVGQHARRVVVVHAGDEQRAPRARRNSPDLLAAPVRLEHHGAIRTECRVMHEVLRRAFRPVPRADHQRHRAAPGRNGTDRRAGYLRDARTAVEQQPPPVARDRRLHVVPLWGGAGDQRGSGPPARDQSGDPQVADVPAASLRVDNRAPIGGDRPERVGVQRAPGRTDHGGRAQCGVEPYQAGPPAAPEPVSASEQPSAVRRGVQPFVTPARRHAVECRTDVHCTAPGAHRQLIHVAGDEPIGDEAFA